jgi:hypothetical protein
MQGDALENQKRLTELDAVNHSLMKNHATKLQLLQAEDDVNEKYFRAAGARAVDLQNRAALAAQQMQVDAMAPGIPKIEAEHGLAINKINTDATLSPDEASARRVAAAEEESRKIGAIWDERDIQEALDQEKETDRLRRNAEEDLNYDRQAAEAERRVKSDSLMGWVSDSQNAMAAIQAQRNEALARLTKDQATAALTTQEMELRRTDIDRTANAEIAAQNQQMAHQIANDLESAFTNPVDFIKRKMQQMFMDIIANWIMQTKLFQSVYGQSMGGIAAGGPTQRGGGSAGLGGAIGGMVRGTFPGHPAGAAGAGAQASAAAASNAAPALDPNSPGLRRTHFMGGGTSEAAQASGSSAGSTAGSFASEAAGGIPGLYRRTAPANASAASTTPDATGAGTSAATSTQNSDYSDVSSMSNVNISGDGGAISDPGADATMPSGAISDPTNTPNIANGIPGPSGNQSSNGGISPSGGAAAGASMLTAAATLGFAGYEGYQDTTAAYKSGSVGGMFKGALGDAMAGMAVGSLFGPMGTLVGAGIGAAIGLTAGAAGLIMGEGGNLAARDYYKKSIFPEIEGIRNGSDGGDYQGAVSQVNKAASDGMVYMDTHWGHSAAQWVDDNYLSKEQKLALGDIMDRARGGGYAVAMSANQFHTGGRITGFGSYGTGGDEGFVHTKLHETVMNPSATQSHGTVLNAMNSGASPTDVARMYLAGPASATAGSNNGGGGDSHLHIHTLDTKTMDTWMRQSGARMIAKHLNGFAGQYAGDGISG